MTIQSPAGESYAIVSNSALRLPLAAIVAGLLVLAGWAVTAVLIGMVSSFNERLLAIVLGASFILIADVLASIAKWMALEGEIVLTSSGVTVTSARQVASWCTPGGWVLSTVFHVPLARVNLEKLSSGRFGWPELTAEATPMIGFSGKPKNDSLVSLLEPVPRHTSRLRSPIVLHDLAFLVPRDRLVRLLRMSWEGGARVRVAEGSLSEHALAELAPEGWPIERKRSDYGWTWIELPPRGSPATPSPTK